MDFQSIVVECLLKASHNSGMESSTQKSSSAAQHLSPEERARWMKIATYASASVACVLIAAKLFAWLWTDSVSLLATLMDSCLLSTSAAAAQRSSVIPGVGRFFVTRH